MIAKVTYPNRRRRKRINFVFEISLPDHVKGWTKNVSANGASFEIITEDIDAFCPGKISGRRVTIAVFFMEKLNFWVPSNN